MIRTGCWGEPATTSFDIPATDSTRAFVNWRWNEAVNDPRSQHAVTGTEAESVGHWAVRGSSWPPMSQRLRTPAVESYCLSTVIFAPGVAANWTVLAPSQLVGPAAATSVQDVSVVPPGPADDPGGVVRPVVSGELPSHPTATRRTTRLAIRKPMLIRRTLALFGSQGKTESKERRQAPDLPTPRGE